MSNTDVATTTIGQAIQDVPVEVLKDFPVDVLERLVAMQEREGERLARKDFVQALSSFREACPQIQKTRENKQFSKVNRAGAKVASKYAALEDIDAIARPVASAHGLIWTWDTTVDDTLMHITCKVLHVGGHSETATVSMPYESKAGASPQQKYAITQQYGMRYSLIAALGITTADEDNDGNTGPEGVISDDQMETLKNKMLDADQKVGIDAAKFLEHLQVEFLKDLPAHKFEMAMNALYRKIEDGETGDAS